MRFSDLGEPINLPLRIAAQVAWGSIRIRLSRSLVTVSSVILAVAFLLVVLGKDLVCRTVHADLTERSRHQRLTKEVRQVLSRRRDDPTMLALCRDRGDDLRAWASGSGVTLPTWDRDSLADLLTLAAWIDGLKPSHQYLLIRTDTTLDHLLGIDQPEEVDAFFGMTVNLRGELPPIGAEDLKSLSRQMAALDSLRQALRLAEDRRLAQVQAAGGRDVVIARIIAGADATALAGWGLPLGQLHDPTPTALLPGVAERLQLMDHTITLAQILGRVREAPDGKSKSKPLGLDEYLERGLVNHQARREIEADIERELGPAGLARVVGSLRQERQLESLDLVFRQMGYDPHHSRQRTFWLVVLSFLVCIVGIVNSMMMAVTERFREIATMKCLGAVDGFILRTFMIESGSIGLVGSTIGSLLGLLIVILQGFSNFGMTFWRTFPVGPLAVAMLAALSCGLVLTIIGALLPAYKAARMHPIEAMRLEA